MIEGFKIPNVTFKVREGDTAENQETCSVGENGLKKIQMIFLKERE